MQNFIKQNLRYLNGHKLRFGICWDDNWIGKAMGNKKWALGEEDFLARGGRRAEWSNRWEVASKFWEVTEQKKSGGGKSRTDGENAGDWREVVIVPEVNTIRKRLQSKMSPIKLSC